MFPVQGVNDVPGSYRGYHSPLEGESQKPSRQAKTDAVGGTPSRRFLPLVRNADQLPAFCSNWASRLAARARLAGSASRATMRCRTERARGSPAAPISRPIRSRFSK